jgi:SAM-dependent methyltransferase
MNNPPWFEIWFDSEYYHLLYAHRDNQEAADFIPRILNKINIKKGSAILDLGCGKGRHALVMQECGYHVTGLDLSPNSIGEAKKLSNHQEPEFYVHDMRMPFRTRYYDVVMNLFTSFGYFETKNDELKTLHSMKLALKPGGIIVIDYLNAHKVQAGLPKSGEKNVQDIQFSWHTKEDADFVVKNILVNDRGRKSEFCERVRLIKPAEFNLLLEDAGLHIIHTFGNYKLDPFVAEHSDRFILVAKAKA